MNGTSRNIPCLLRCFFGFCLAAFPGSSACPKLCACYVPTEVHCTFRYLTTIPPHISPNVERINLGYNSLVKLTETDFSGLEKLELLMLHSNQIRTIQDRTFSDLHALQVLKMSYNKIKVIRADTFQGLISLVRLHVDHNQIEFVNPHAFYGLTSLKLVHLEGNLLKQLHPDTFATLRYLHIFKTSSIKHIYLSDNFLTSLPEDIFSYMSNLESLYLHGNPWTCDCTLRWFAEWAKQQTDVVKCKRDRAPLSILHCPLCASPKSAKGKQLTGMPLSGFTCVKPTIDTTLKLKNITLPDDGNFISVSPRDFMAPLGSMVLNMTDQAGNQANLACNVQKPAKLSPVMLKRINNITALEISLSTFLVCNINYEYIQPLWSILALYSNSQLKLKRDHLLTGVPYISYKYKQMDSENEELFTNIEAELRSEPPWLMQGQVSLQLDRTATTLNTMHIQYLVDGQITLPSADSKSARQNWAMILRENSTRTECSVLVGESVELNCLALGKPTPVLEWVLADGSKVRAPYVSEDGRMVITKSGKLILHTADNFDSGVYHCIGTNYDDADVLTFRITVIDSSMEHDYFNGPQLSAFLGETLYLPCQSTGSPDASVTWILPEQTVLHHSSKTKLLFHNGTLKIEHITDQDSGYFKCVTANQYGVDVLVYQVLVKRNPSRLQKLDMQIKDEAAEGSGNELLENITKPQNPSLAIQIQVTNQVSTEASSINYPTLNKTKNNYKDSYRYNRNKINKRFRGWRRQFSTSNRRIDPLRWAAFLEKTKNTTLLRKQQNATVKPTVKVLLSSVISENEEEASGDDVFAGEEFMLLATKRPAVYTLREASGNVATAALGSISGNYTSLPTSGIVSETEVPVFSPMVTHSRNQKLVTELKSETEKAVLAAPPTPSTSTESSTIPPSKLSSSTTESVRTFQILSEETNVHLKIPPTVVPATNVTKSSCSVTSCKNTEKSDLFEEATNKMSQKLNSHVSVMTVGVPVDVNDYNTQRITTPRIPAGSTTITSQQINIVKNAVTYSPLSRRYGRRRKITSRRRIVRPDQINIASDRFAYLRLGFTKESTTLLPPEEVSIPTSAPPNRLFEQVISKAPISTSFETYYPEAKTASQTLTFSSNKPDAVKKHTTSTIIPFYLKNIQAVSHRKITSGTLLQAVTDTNLLSSIKFPITIIHSPKISMGTTSTNVGISPLAIKPTLPTLGTNASSSVSEGKFHWQNFFGGNHVQKEGMGKQSILQASEESSAVASVMPLQTTIPMYSISSEYKAADWKIENQMDDLINLIKPIDDNMTQTKNNSVLPLSTTELPSSSYASSLATALRKEIHTTSITPNISPTATAHLEKKVSKFKVFGPGRRRGQRRRRPMKKLVPSHKNIINKKITTVPKETKGSPILEITKKIIQPASPTPTELFSKFTNMDVITTRLQPVTSTTDISRDNASVMTAWILARSTSTENTHTAKLPLENMPSAKPATTIPLTVSFLDTVNPATEVPTTTMVTLAPVSTKPTQTTIVADKEAYHNVEWKTIGEKPATQASLPLKPGLSSQVSNAAQEPNQLTSQTVFMPHETIAQTTASPDWRKTSWHEPLERGKTLIVNTFTMLKSPQSSTEYTPLWRKSKNNHIKGMSEKTADLESTTATNLFALNAFYQTRVEKPRIIGGKFAAFTALADSDAFIPCEATGNPLPTIHWTKISSGVDAPKQKRDNRFEVLPNGTLSIQNVNVQDRGQYLCVAANQYGSDKLLITLSVVTYPPRILGRRSKVITVHSGKALAMKCTAEGRPIPTISWVLANKTYVSESSTGNEAVFLQPDGTLVIKKVSVYDRGIYTCTANNPAGSDTVTIRLQVVAAPPIILEEKKQHVIENTGQSLRFPCTAKGNPYPDVHWVLFDGTVVKPLQYINGKLFLFPNGTLYIRNIASSDSGNYECIATSSTGSERRVVVLQVKHSDIIPRIAVSSQRLTQMSFGDNLLLNCSATGEPKPKIIWRLPSKAVVDQWHRMGSRIHVHPNGSLAIKTVTEKDAGDYICVARNKMGDDLILMKVSVTMKPAKIDQKQYFMKLVPYGKDFKVDCKASGAPEPEISWSLPDGTMINNVMQADDSGHRSRRYTLFDNGTLYFNKVGIAEEGDYTCYAQNTLGKDEMKVHITVVATAPRIKQDSKKDAKVKAGDTARFDCDATGEPKPKIFWLLPSNDMISASTHRYFLHTNGSLSVTKVKLIDAGEYICVARNSGGDDTKQYKLEVVSKPPLINGLYTNKTIIKMTAIRHSKKQIHCRAEGTPIPQVMWIMPDNIFLTAPYYGSRITVHQNGTLEIRNVRPSDTAEFICVARNDGGESILVVQLEVLEMLRRPMFRNPFNEKVIAKSGKTTFLNCSVDGNPPPEIMWMLPNGTRLSSGFKTARYFLESNGTLVIYGLSNADSGKYRCAAKNKVGYIEKLIILEVGQKPTIFIHPKGTVKGISGESLFLHCLAGGNPKPNIIWTVPSGYVLVHPQINEKYTLLENGTLVIQETTIHDRGSYTCKAQNYAGDSTVTVFVIIVAHPPRITNRPPRNVRAVAGVAVQLHCMALGIPNPEITWELPDRSLLSTGSKGQPPRSEFLHPQGTLVIQNPKSSDSGMYKCMAKNQLGSDSVVTYVQVI